MSPWFGRRRTEPQLSDSSVHYVFAAVTIAASRQRVWDFIKPAENGVLVDPGIVRGFSAPGVRGTGEIQVFIEVRDGAESVSAIEVVHEIPYEMAVTRVLGNTDPAARGRDFLQDAENGATIFEHGQYFTFSAAAPGYLSQYKQHHRLYCQQYVERVKAVLERSQV